MAGGLFRAIGETLNAVKLSIVEGEIVCASAPTQADRTRRQLLVSDLRFTFCR